MYHQNNSLLFRFVLIEFMLAYQEIQPLPALLDEIKTTFYPVPQLQKREHYLHLLKTSLIKLSGYSPSQHLFFSWHLDHGLLAKLKNYSLFLRQNLDPKNPELTSLKKNAEKAWSCSLQCIDMIHSIEHEEISINAYDQIQEILNKTIASLHRIARSFIRLISYFIEDENVIYFLICYHTQIERLYGTGFLSKLLNKIYPKGLQDVTLLLKEKYRRRGFENIVATIDEKIGQLSNVAP